MKIDGIDEPESNWQNPFLEIALRGIRKANFNFENWDLNQIPSNLENSDFNSLNNGWGVFRAPEEHTCSYITQEFAISPFTKGYWAATDQKGIKEQRWYMIEREFHLGIKNIYPNADFTIWSAKLKEDGKDNDSGIKNQVFDNSTNSRWADVLINRIGYTPKDFEFYIRWYPVLIEAKRITKLSSKINFKPKLEDLKINREEVIKDVRKLLGLKIGIIEKNTIINHPHKDGLTDNFFPAILFWGLKKDCDNAIEYVKKNTISIEYNNSEYIISKWFGLCKEYPHRIKNYEKDLEKDEVLKVVLLQFNHEKK